LEPARKRHVQIAAQGHTVAAEASAMFFEAKMAVFEAMKPDIETLPPVERRRFAEACRRWADLAETPLALNESTSRAPASTSGVLWELKRGFRSEE
jgi:hypothetical protein